MALDITLTAETLPQPACYPSEQARHGAFTAAIQVNVSGGIQWVTQQNEPDDKTVYWLRTDSSGLPVGAYVWETADGAWVPWQYELMFGEGAGSLNAFTVTNTPPIGNGALFMVGRMISFISTQNITGASTVTVDGGPSHAIKKAGVADLQSGDIVVGMTVVLQWDGANWQMINPIKPSPAATTNLFNSGLQSVPTGDGGLIALNHLLPGIPQEVQWFLVCNDAAPISSNGSSTPMGYALGDRVRLVTISTITDNDVMVAEIVNATQVQAGPFPWATLVPCVPLKNGPVTGGNGAGGFTYTITPSQWKIQCLATYTPP